MPKVTVINVAYISNEKGAEPFIRAIEANPTYMKFKVEVCPAYGSFAVNVVTAYEGTRDQIRDMLIAVMFNVISRNA